MNFGFLHQMQNATTIEQSKRISQARENLRKTRKPKQSPMIVVRSRITVNLGGAQVFRIGDNESAPKRDAAKTLKTVRASNGVHAKTRVWENIGSGSTGNAENIKAHGTQLTFDSPHQANASRRNIGPGQLQKLLQTSGHAVASAHRTIGRGQLQDRVRNAAADALR